MLSDKNINKETIKILIQENRRLKRENQRLHESLQALDRYKNEYRSLIDELRQVKECYIGKMKYFDKLENEYRKELDRVMG